MKKLVLYCNFFKIILIFNVNILYDIFIVSKEVNNKSINKQSSIIFCQINLINISTKWLVVLIF